MTAPDDPRWEQQERMLLDLEAHYPELADRGPAVRTLAVAQELYGRDWYDAEPSVVIDRVTKAYRLWRSDPPVARPPRRKPWWRRLFG